jgi:hypothetical protein
MPLAALSAIRCSVSAPFRFNYHLCKTQLGFAPLELQLESASLWRIATSLIPILEVLKPFQTPAQAEASTACVAAQDRVRVVHESDFYAIYLDFLELGSLDFSLSWQNSGSGRAPVLLPASWVSFRDLQLHFAPFHSAVSARPQTLLALTGQLAGQYRSQALRQVLPALGSLEILGNPSRLVRDLRGAFRLLRTELFGLLFSSSEEEGTSDVLGDAAKGVAFFSLSALNAVLMSAAAFNAAMAEVMDGLGRGEQLTPFALPASLGQLQGRLRAAAEEEAAAAQAQKAGPPPPSPAPAEGQGGLLGGWGRAWAQPCRAVFALNATSLSALGRWLSGVGGRLSAPALDDSPLSGE